MRTSKYPLKLLFSRLVTASTLILLSSFSSGVAPIKAHFIMGMDIQGQRLNPYKDCEEGYVTCDNMLLVAGNLGQLLQIDKYGKRLYGQDSANELYKEQIAWIKQRSDICGADVLHLPRSQAERVCFIQQNEARSQAYFY